jgi:hypothetical protein
MGFLFKKSKPPASAVPQITGLQVQTSVNVLGKPIIYGSPRVGLNLIWANDFTSKQTTTGGGHSSGKGAVTGGKGGGSGQTVTTYYANIILAIGEGALGGSLGHPIYLFKDQQILKYASDTGGFDLFYGGDGGQSADPTVASLHPDQSRAYRHTSYLLGINYQLDASGTIPQHNVVVPGRLAGSCPLASDPVGGLEDADPAQVVVDVLTNQFYGAGFPSALISANIYTTSNGFDPSIGDPNYQTWCQAAGFGLSFAISDFEQSSSIVQRILDSTNSVAVWNAVELNFVPYADGQASGNPNLAAGSPVYFNNPITIAASFGDYNVIQTEDNSDPVAISRKDGWSAYNVVRVSYQERGNAYNSALQEFPVDSAVELYGRREEDLASNVFTVAGYAYLAAQLRAQRNVHVKNTVSFKTSWEYAYLDPMSFILVTDPVTCPDGMVCRIMSIEEDEQGLITITGEEV